MYNFLFQKIESINRQLPVSKMVLLIKKIEQGPKYLREYTGYLYRKQKEEIERINIQLPVSIFVPFDT